MEFLEDRAAPAGLVAAYSFNEGSGTTVTDASGNGNAGTIANATWTTAGKFGSALSFNGTNARVNINDAPSLHFTTGMTLEAWVRPTTVSSVWRDVIYKGDDNYYLEATSTTGSRPAGGMIAGGTHAEAFGATTLATNTWTHLATTYDGAMLRLYVNGVQVSSVAKTGNILTLTNQLQLGGDSIYGCYFAGLIDEVRIYNVALTTAQIQADMNTPVGNAPPDTQPPTAPSNLLATAVSTSQINLSWTAATDNVGVTGYRVERRDPGSSSFVQIGTTTGTTFNDTGLAAGTSYDYQVRASDAAGNLGAYSAVATATTQTPDTQPPTAPSNLLATAVSASQINLSWTAATDNVGVTGYRVERRDPGSSSFVQIGTTTGTTFNNTGLAAGTSYDYQVRASDAAGNTSSPSTPASATTQSIGSSTGYPRLSADGTYIVDKDNQPFFIVGDAAWSLIAQLNDADTVTYLSDRSSRGFNTIITNLLEHKFASRAPADINGDLPFTGVAFQSAENEAYFAHADYVIQQAQNYGITVLLYPAYAGFQAGDEGWGAEMQAATDQQMYAWGQYVGNRYRNYDNVIWVIGADANPADYPNLRSRLNQVALGISSTDTNHRLITAQNWLGNSAMDSWSNYSWLTLNSVYNHTNVAGASASNYARAGALPLFSIEDNYENEHSMTALQLRQEAYWEVLNGCTLGRVFGNNPIWGFSYLSSSWSSSLGSSGSVSQSWLGKLMRSREFWLMAPDLSHTVVTAGYGSGSSLTVTSRSSDGETIISYIPNGNSTTVTVDMSEIIDVGSRTEAWWFNPQTGSTAHIGSYANSGMRTFTPPDRNDWVLVIDSAAASLPAPGSASASNLPVAEDDSYSTNKDTTLTVAAPGVLANDTEVDGNPLAAALVTGVSHGTLTLNFDGSFTYTPAANYIGLDRFTYRGNDGTAYSNTATVSITVNPINDPPVAANDSYSTNEDTTLTVAAPGVLANDTDVDGNPLTAVLIASTSTDHGTLTLNANGSFTYTPAANYNGPDSFTYRANDGTANSNTATVSIIVNAVNDVPVAANDSYATNVDTALTVAAPGVLANDTDVDGDPLTAAVVTTVSHGTLTLNANGSFTYTSTVSYTGPDSFTYRANDGTANSNTATVSITVNAVNNAPVAANDSYSTNEDTALTVAAPGVLANDTDADGDPLTAAVVTTVSHGTLTLNANGSFTYTPAANYHGADSFTYRANDGTANSNTATVSITINPVNDAPVAANDSYTTNQGTTLTVTAPGVLANDSDVDGNPLTAALVTGVRHGTLTLNANGSFTYTPAANYHGADSFTYRANDGMANSNTATVSITIRSRQGGHFYNTALKTAQIQADVSIPVGNTTPNIQRNRAE